MKKKIVSVVALFFIILISIFTGYEKPGLVEVPKSIVKNPRLYYDFALYKIGLRDNILEKKNQSEQTNDKEKIENEYINKPTEIKGNSFSAITSKVKSFTEKSAALIISAHESDEAQFQIFTQDGFIIDNNKKREIDLPLFYYGKQDGGIKSVILIEDQYFALVSLKKFSCLYLSFISLKNRKEIIKSDCLPNPKGVDFGGSGGAYVFFKDKILLTVGAPEHNAPDVAELAQLESSIFGKILSIKKDSLLNYNNEDVEFNIFSTGHRNPQGMVLLNNDIFSLEHGPQGGDEFNKIIYGKNYGWPIVSFGTQYGDGKSYSQDHASFNFEEPMYSFIPAVAPSALNKCPKNISDYYKNNNCLMGLSLRAMSILIFLLDKDNTRVVNVEKILFKKRLRHFGLDKSGVLYLDEDNHFYITADRDGLYKVKFDKFR